MSSQAWINLTYLAASMLFIVAFKLMTGPRTAVKGNYLGAVGMAIALIAACFEKPVLESVAERGAWPLVLVGIAAAIGADFGGGCGTALTTRGIGSGGAGHEELAAVLPKSSNAADTLTFTSPVSGACATSAPPGSPRIA